MNDAAMHSEDWMAVAVATGVLVATAAFLVVPSARLAWYRWRERKIRARIARLDELIRAGWDQRGVYGWQDWTDETDREAMVTDYRRENGKERFNGRIRRKKGEGR